MVTTLKELSKIMGVSISTVSRALNNDKSISTDIRNKIIKLADEHHYKKRKTRADNIMYLIDKSYFSSTNKFYNVLIEGIEDECKNNDYIFNFNTLDSNKFSMDDVNINFKKVAGIIITGCYHDNLILEIKKLNIPIIFVDYYIPTENICSVLIDNIDGISLGIKYLASLGHKRIAFLPGDYKNDIGAHDRLVGYLRSVEMFDLEKDQELIINCGFSFNNAYESMKKFLLSKNKYPTAVIGVNDMVVIGAMEAIKEKGLKIPQEISVLGFDNIDLSNEVKPRLSTLHIKKKTMGKLAVRWLVKIIQGLDLKYNKIMLNPELIIRESTSKVPK